MIYNFLSKEHHVVQNMHDGQGDILEQILFTPENLKSLSKKSPWDFAVRLIMPPLSSIGLHQHGNNEEIYILLSGEGSLQLDHHVHTVKKGDIIFNRPYGSHGLTNDSTQEIELLVIQASNKNEEK